ncbi:MAG: LD-carboxypeptidase [Actinomycetes bacterium]
MANLGPSFTRRDLLVATAAVAGTSVFGGLTLASCSNPTSAVRFPAALPSGGTIGICAPSAGVPKAVAARYEFAVNFLRQRGYRLIIAGPIVSDAIVSAPAPERAAALQSLLTNPEVDVVLPPWGGELLIDILPLLDWTALRTAQPPWVVGYSDLSTFQVPYLLNTGTASLDGSNLLETPINPPAPGLKWWPDVVSLPAGSNFQQTSATAYQSSDVDWAKHPTATTFELKTPSRWKILGHEGDPGYTVTASGRIIAGTIDVLAPLAGSRFGDVRAFARRVSPDKLIIALDAADFNTAQYARALWDLRGAGWFDSASMIVLGRTGAEQVSGFTVRDAANDALAGLAVPVVYDADIGHLPPQMAWVLGATATLAVGGGRATLSQTLA